MKKKYLSLVYVIIAFLVTCVALYPLYMRFVNEKFIISAIDGKYDNVEFWLRLGADIDFKKGGGALHFAILNGDARTLRIICAHDPDTSISNAGGFTPLKLAELQRCSDWYLEIMSNSPSGLDPNTIAEIKKHGNSKSRAFLKMENNGIKNLK